ncbi:MAG: bifunctional transaldolase/phosoglucose isomerase [Anaerolineales bacterium]|nr:bifunctional transaldolase/phosoglucose isomerase [Anaerolineales bacterium]
MPNLIAQLTELGQSLWYDNVQRRLLENGEMAAMIARGDIRGVTSNPTIFHNAIAKTADYDPALIPMAWAGWDAEQIFWQLAIEDIRQTCELFLPLYQESEGGDGYVSLEVDPALAHSTEATVAQARTLWEWVEHPNLMIKVPATKEGLPAVRRLIADGINVNVTLIFSLPRYQEVMDAYLAGLEERLQAGLPVQDIASVASFFVSRLDTKVDGLLESVGTVEGLALRGRAAIANARLAYDAFRQVFGGERFASFQSAGCRMQRPLWASTSTKNPAYADTFYVDELIGPATVNTVPPQTLDAFRDHGRPRVTILDEVAAARQLFFDLEAVGVSIDRVTAELEAEGVRSFAEAFAAMLATIEERRAAAAAALGPLSASVSRRLASLVAEDAPARLQAVDPTLWTSDPAGQDEIRKRLGWVTLPETSRLHVKAIADFAARARADDLTHTLLLGMGGSSLAPEVMARVFGQADTFAILDSTDPAQVLETEKRFPLEKTLLIVASKSGGTAEVMAAFEYFWDKTGGNGKHFVAITDPGTSLDALANARGFLAIFHADPTVGGRFSALTHFGLVPAALMGIDLERMLDHSAGMSAQCGPQVSGARNPGLVLGAVLGEAALLGRDKLTLVADPAVGSFGSWLEQLIAESSGKQGRGIVVVDGEPLGEPCTYGDDRLFVYLRADGAHDRAVAGLRAIGQPVLSFAMPDPYNLFAEIYRWEMATAYACAVLGVNAFDQPDVQDNKDRTRAKLDAYSHTKRVDDGNPVWEQEGVKIYAPGKVEGQDLDAVLTAFLKAARKGDYLAINAYLPRNEAMGAALAALRLKVRALTGCATTVGFGPRFLHSTGQLHKGGPESGLFLQITADPAEDLDIPGQGMSFGVLERCQALGDYEALAARERRILRVHLPEPTAVKRLIR